MATQAANWFRLSIKRTSTADDVWGISGVLFNDANDNQVNPTSASLSALMSAHSYPNGSLANLCDGNDATNVLFGPKWTSTEDWFIDFYLDVPKAVSALSINWTEGHWENVLDFELYSSVDGTTWVLEDVRVNAFNQQTIISGWVNYLDIKKPSISAHRYWRFVDVADEGFGVVYCQMQFKDAHGTIVSKLGTASASASDNLYYNPPSAIFDAPVEDFFAIGQGYDKGWISYDCVVPRHVEQVYVKLSTYYRAKITQAKVQFSDDNVSWIDAVNVSPISFVAAGSSRATATLMLSEPVIPVATDPHAWWGIQINAVASSTWNRVEELQLRATPGGPNLCGAGLGTASASNTYPGWPASNAFDGAITGQSYWLDNNGVGQKLMYHLNTPAVVQEATLWVSPWTGERIKSWDLIFSDDGVNWYVAKSVTNFTTVAPAETITAMVLNAVTGVCVETPLLTIESSKTLAEGNTGATNFNFALSIPTSTIPVTVGYQVVNSTTDTSDFQGGVLPTGTITFLPGEISKNISVVVLGDVTQEANEVFYVRLSNVLNVVLTSYVARGNNAATGTIVNDDTWPSGTVPGTIDFIVGQTSPITGVSVTEGSSPLNYVSMQVSKGALDVTPIGACTIETPVAGAYVLRGPVADVNSTLATMKYIPVANPIAEQVYISIAAADNNVYVGLGTLWINVIVPYVSLHGEHPYWGIRVRGLWESTWQIVIPEIIMRSVVGGENICTGGVAGSLNPYVYGPDRAFGSLPASLNGGDIGQFYMSTSNPVLPVTLYYHFANPEIVRQMEIYVSNWNGERMTNFDIVYSDDGVNFIVAEAVDNFYPENWGTGLDNNGNGLDTIGFALFGVRDPIDVTQPQPYWGLRINKLQSPTNQANMLELVLKGELGGANLCVGGNTGGTGYSNVPAAFDGIMDDQNNACYGRNPINATDNFYYHFATNVKIAEYDIYTSVVAQDRPTDWELICSDDGIRWAVADKYTGFKFYQPAGTIAFDTFVIGEVTVPIHPEHPHRFWGVEILPLMWSNPPGIVELVLKDDYYGDSLTSTAILSESNSRNENWWRVGKLADGSLNDFQGHWLGTNLSTAQRVWCEFTNPVRLAEIEMYLPQWNWWRPVDWNMIYSDDGVEWTTFDSVRGFEHPPEGQGFGVYRKTLNPTVQAWFNNTATKLQVPLSPTGKKLTLVNPTIPVLNEHQFVTITVQEKAKIEIMKVSVVAGNVLTIAERGLEGTTPQSFTVAAKVYVSNTSATINWVYQSLKSMALSVAGLFKSAIRGQDNGGDSIGSRAVSIQTGRDTNDRVASGMDSLVIGYNAKATGYRAAAIGAGSECKYDHGVAINNSWWRLNASAISSPQTLGEISEYSKWWYGYEAGWYCGIDTCFATEPLAFDGGKVWTPATKVRHLSWVQPTVPNGWSYAIWDNAFKYDDALNATYAGSITGATEPVWGTTYQAGCSDSNSDLAYTAFDLHDYRIPLYEYAKIDYIDVVAYSAINVTSPAYISIGTVAEPTLLVDNAVVNLTRSMQYVRLPLGGTYCVNDLKINIVTPAVADELLCRVIFGCKYLKDWIPDRTL